MNYTCRAGFFTSQALVLLLLHTKQRSIELIEANLKSMTIQNHNNDNPKLQQETYKCPVWFAKEQCRPSLASLSAATQKVKAQINQAVGDLDWKLFCRAYLQSCLHEVVEVRLVIEDLDKRQSVKTVQICGVWYILTVTA